MNIQQLRYVVAIANSGTFREAASKLFVSQPSLSVAIKDLENELEFKIFERKTTGVSLTRRGQEFYEKAKELVKRFESFETQFSHVENRKEFSISSQHYDFLPPLITRFAEKHPEHADFRIYESTTVQILDEVAQGYSELGIIYLNPQNQEGIQKRLANLNLEVVSVMPFQTHIYVREDHPLTAMESVTLDDLDGLETVRFTQEKEEYLFYSENLIDTSKSSAIYKVTDRATLNGILQRTDAYATGSGFLDSNTVDGITVIPLENAFDNELVYVRRAERSLSRLAESFTDIMKDYFEAYQPRGAK